MAHHTATRGPVDERAEVPSAPQRATDIVDWRDGGFITKRLMVELLAELPASAIGAWDLKDTGSWDALIEEQAAGSTWQYAKGLYNGGQLTDDEWLDVLQRRSAGRA